MQTALMIITLGSGKAILMKITSRMIIQKIKWLIRKTNSNHLQSAAEIFKCIDNKNDYIFKTRDTRSKGRCNISYWTKEEKQWRSFLGLRKA